MQRILWRLQRHKLNRSMKQKILQTVKTAVIGVLTLLLLVLTILELIPEPDIGVTLKEPVTVYSELTDATNGIYETAVAGVILNESDDMMKIHSITVTVTNGTQDKAIKLYLSEDNTAFDLPARTQREFSKSELDTASFTEIKSVEVELDGKTHELSNLPEKAIDTIVWILIALLLLSAYLLYRSILVTYYTFTEKK